MAARRAHREDLALGTATTGPRWGRSSDFDLAVPTCAFPPDPPFFIRYTATMPVVSGFLAFFIRYIVLGCSGLKGLTCAAGSLDGSGRQWKPFAQKFNLCRRDGYKYHGQWWSVEYIS